MRPVNRRVVRDDKGRKRVQGCSSSWEFWINDLTIFAAGVQARTHESAEDAASPVVPQMGGQHHRHYHLSWSNPRTAAFFALCVAGASSPCSW